jgi:hypothetical protein
MPIIAQPKNGGKAWFVNMSFHFFFLNSLSFL